MDILNTLRGHWQEATVALVVVFAFAGALWWLLPRSWRHKLLRKPGPAPTTTSACEGCPMRRSGGCGKGYGKGYGNTAPGDPPNLQ
ncbi:hypothetical protein [Candidatus Symbiobacter mobilis]|uniref:hypothetical protein n=1 Tax=Candidatus Symbiobacter mobilis TaxID=1436290 RepID=UPI00124653C7|nr:hypothetical protein [Candidatus Symbiobacter mobilis]